MIPGIPMSCLAMGARGFEEAPYARIQQQVAAGRNLTVAKPQGHGPRWRKRHMDVPRP